MGRPLFRYALIAVIATGLVLIASPLFVASGVRAWLWWQARQLNLTCTVAQIKAPFLHPVELRGIHIRGKGASRLEVNVTQLSVDLSLRSILLRASERAIHSIAAQQIDAELRRAPSSIIIPERTWTTVQKLLPDKFSVGRLNLRVEDGATVVVLREVSMNGDEIETGAFAAGEVMISSPMFRQTFSGLRGATNWQDDRLTIAGLSLVRGLDVQSITADLSELQEQQVGLEFDIDAFGGKIRANVSNDWRSHHASWNVAGSATDISLEQTSRSLGFTDQVNGMLHACKFTFRGDSHDPANATASLWTELTSLSWRKRAADVIMLGAVLYNRQVQLQQLYVKQGKNQLTLNGEAAFPTKTFDWLNPDFRGTISASISNLGDFASLFGADAGDFGGEVAIEGTMNAGNRKIGGHLSATGSSLSILKMPVDTFAAKINLSPASLEIEQLELLRQHDFVRGEGRIDLGKEHAYSGKATVAVDKIADYLGLVPRTWRNLLTNGAVTGEWSGTGKADSHSGNLRVHGRGLRMATPNQLLPFNAELQADYSPGNLFFRQFHVANDHASLNGFVTLADRYVQLQAIALDVNSKPKLRGNVFVPVSISRLRSGSRLPDAIDPAQKLDVDISVDPTDLAEVSTALTGRNLFSGMFAARLSIFGGADALQGWADFHARDFATANDAARLSTDGDLRFASGTMNGKASVVFAGSSPINLEANLPVRITRWDEAASAEPISANLNFPAVFANRLPRYLSRDVLRDGIVSGKVDVSGSLRYPSLSGDLQLTNGKLGPTPINLTEASARFSFHGQGAAVDFLNLGNEEILLSLHGTLGFADLAAMELQLTAGQPIVDLAPRRNGECISNIRVRALPITEPLVANIDGIAFRGGLFRKPWTVSVTDRRADQAAGPIDAAAAIRSFPFCGQGTDDGAMLIFGCETRPHPTPEGPRAPRKKRKRH